jgi:hypothetical protein
MSILDEITKEKQRVTEALTRVEAQREKLASQLVELEATERVLARYSKGSGARKIASARTPMTATNAASSARAGGRPRSTTTKPVGGKRGSPSLNDQVLALATGLARTMSVPRLPGTSGPAVSKSGMESSTSRSRHRRNRTPRSENRKRARGQRAPLARIEGRRVKRPVLP